MNLTVFQYAKSNRWVGLKLDNAKSSMLEVCILNLPQITELKSPHDRSKYQCCTIISLRCTFLDLPMMMMK